MRIDKRSYKTSPTVQSEQRRKLNKYRYEMDVERASIERSMYSGIQPKMVTDHSESANYARNVS
jgi:hypothetical protein